MTTEFLYYKVYGERNSGTNYLQKVLSSNFLQQELIGDHGRVYDLARKLSEPLQSFDQAAIVDRIYDVEMKRLETSDFGWKHAAPPVEVIRSSPICRLTLFVIIMKHPFFWAKSMFKKPFHVYGRAQSFAEYIRSPQKLSERDQLLGRIALTPIEIWAEKTRRYAELCSQPGVQAVVYRYEDLLTNFQDQIGRTAEMLTPKSKVITNVIQSTKEKSLKFDDYRSKYDLSKASLALSANDAAYIREHLQEDVVSWSGYEI